MRGAVLGSGLFHIMLLVALLLVRRPTSTVVAYNHLLGRLRDLGNGTAAFASEYLERRLGVRES